MTSLDDPAAFGAVYDRHHADELGLTVDGTYKDAFGC